MSHTRRTQAERSATTRAALLGAARELFAAQGYAATGREEIVERAGVTRGALYHHFTDKAGLFLAVYEQLEQEMVTAIAEAAASAKTPLDQLRRGSRAFLEAAATDPAVQRVTLIDGPSVLTTEQRHALSERYGLGLIREALRAAMASRQLARQPVEPLAHVLLAGLHEAALYIAQAPDAAKARRDVGKVIDRIIDGL